MDKVNVHLLRGGSPEKIGLTGGNSYNLYLEDNLNLYSINIDILNHWIAKGDYIIPADEQDIQWCHDTLNYSSNILLPKLSNGKIIPYNWVSKNNAMVYKRLYQLYLYPYTFSIPVNYIIYDKIPSLRNKVVKLQYGSGSREVLIKPSKYELKKFISDRKLSFDCRLLIQQFIEYEQGFTCDFQFREGKLLGYGFINYPNNIFDGWRWNKGEFVHDNFTDKIAEILSNFLLEELGIVDGFIETEGFWDNSNKFMLNEINWRYSGVSSDLQAFGIDIIDNYLQNKTYKCPRGKFTYFMSRKAIIPSFNSNYKNWKLGANYEKN